jgi:hypothetical protein
MPQTSQACDRVQELLLPPNLRESAARRITQRGLVLHVVAPVDLAGVDRRIAVTGERIMVALLHYSCAIGERSCRGPTIDDSISTRTRESARLIAKVENDLDPLGSPSAHAQSPPLSCRP